MKKVNIIDVAQLAGVSVSTVSLVLRRKGKISDATKEKVQAAIEQLGYVHNVAAANLRANTSNLIGVIIRNFSDAFSISVMASIVRELEQQGFMVFLGQPQDDEKQLRQCLTSFAQQGVAGVIYLSANPFSRQLPQAIVQCTLPLVVVSESLLDGDRDLIERDNRHAASRATRYLIERGHRNIAYLGGDAQCLLRQERLLGYRSALQQYDLPFRDDWAPCGEENTQSAATAIRNLLENSNKITAVLCHSAAAIIGCISGVQQVGRTIGKDVFLTQQVSLVGFEDMLHINLTSPSFTYVSSASDETGRQAAALMLKKIGEPSLAAQRIVISGQLVQRDSA
ncbi:Mal regulon transcriptional regulator MalI [Serratia sp. AKBS12]|uniref:Mal regulon transcriptional regulator MalI n=1 Tax=Serratia sp. AKBS12 TaxID=2974597 RepID=UPI002165A184|nr:Mal regulon transcriptional regulator MalI [Serratia sp. AKBS12]MCS3407028.1 Mal regulon transcriptional regulator MalI [Serratia sp. AKBS12]